MKLRGPLALLAAATVFAAAPAHAEIDIFGYGDGHRGSFTASAAGTVVNAYASLSVDVAAGATSLPLTATTGFSSGDLVLVVRVSGYVPAPASGDAGVVDLSSSPVGLWELARVSSVGGGALALAAPMVNGFAASGSEVVVVPEYTDVTIAAGTSIVATPWNGTTGGIVAFLARGAVTNDGAISADAAGFRGGAFATATSVTTGCTGLDQASPQGGAKGEGIASGAASGRGNVANGGGGADCSRSGGGGGGNAAQGGGGGSSETADGSRAVGGVGGAPLAFSLLSRIELGGGGGAGQGSTGDGAPGSAGGGVVFVRAVAQTGGGRVSARGGTYTDASGNPLTAGTDGAGGGGAGGSVYLRFVQGAQCTALDVSGGAGAGIASEGHGPGGGGSGGRALVQASSLSCPASAAGGAAGAAPSGSSYGALAGNAGASETPPVGGYCAGSADCSGATPSCDVARGVCFECVGPGDCTNPSKPVCETTGALANHCTQCSSSSAKLCTGGAPVCLANDTCGCNLDSDCPSAAPVCDPATHACVNHCVSDADCTATPLLHCDTSAATPTCVVCVADANCSSGEVCSASRACVECTPQKTAACSKSGAGAICLASGTCGCASDSDCGGSASGRVCDSASRVCALGCRGTGGNGCPAGQACSSKTAAVGTCAVPPVDGGPAPGPSELADSGHLGGGGGGCSVLGGSGASGSAAALLAAWLVGAILRGALGRARRRRVS